MIIKTNAPEQDHRAPEQAPSQRLADGVTREDEAPIPFEERRVFAVLVVDDDRVDRAFVRRALANGGMNVDVVEADSCALALQILSGRRFDCVFLDYHLPDRSGLSLLKEIQAMRQDLPVVMLTGQGNEQIAVQAMKAGATDYVIKDLAPAAIAQSLRSALRVRRSDLERRRAEAALRESEERFRLLVEGAKDYAMFLLDLSGRIRTWNSGAERIFGYARGEIVGEYFGVLFSEEDQEWRVPDELLRTAGHDGRAEEAGWHTRKDGVFWGEGTLVAVSDDFGAPRGYEMILRDATERKRAEDALADAKDQQQRFLRDVLASVTNGRLRLCQALPDLPEAMARFGQPIFLESWDSIAHLRRVAAEAAASQGFSQERANDLLTGVGEAAMNAVVHASGGRGQICVGPDGCVQVWIEDDGRGISMDALPRATLERGYTTANTLGHGFKLLLQTIDRIWLMTGPSGTAIALEQDRDAPDPLIEFSS